MPILTVIRGICGSGKTTLAKTYNCFHLETDMYFMKDGSYLYDPAVIKSAHDAIFGVFKAFVDNIGADVVVSNTFIKKWEYERYIDYAKTKGYTVNVVIANGNYGNTHNVPEEVVQRMKNSFEY